MDLKIIKPQIQSLGLLDIKNLQNQDNGDLFYTVA